MEKEEIPPQEEKEHTEKKPSKIRVRALLGNTTGKTSTSNSSLSLIWENYGLGFNQMFSKTTSSKNNVYEMKNSSLDLSYTLDFTYKLDLSYISVEYWSATLGVGYVYGGKGSITRGSPAIKYETESGFRFWIIRIIGDRMGRSRRFNWCKVLQIQIIQTLTVQIHLRFYH